MNGPFLPPPHPLGRAPISPVYGIVGLPFVSLRGRNCRFRSHLGCSGLGLAFSLECLDARMVLLTRSGRFDRTFAHKLGASRTVERKEILIIFTTLQKVNTQKRKKGPEGRK